jgi:hypothetical protein
MRFDAYEPSPSWLAVWDDVGTFLLESAFKLQGSFH